MKQSIALLLSLYASGLFAQTVLTADEAVRIAVEQNHGIRLARLDARSAELLNNAGQAGMLPLSLIHISEPTRPY